MGEMADYYLGLALDQGESPFSSRRRRTGRPEGSSYGAAAWVPKDLWCVTCTKCCMQKLKWILDDGGHWTLYENERVEHNRLKSHVCAQDIPTTEGFDDVD